jgi:hypothetical protein
MVGNTVIIYVQDSEVESQKGHAYKNGAVQPQLLEIETIKRSE